MKKGGGYSLIELLLTVVFVTLGTLMVQGSFMRAADMFGRYSNTLKVMVWANEESAKSLELLVKEELATGSQSGALSGQSKDFKWTRDVRQMAGPNLYSIRLAVDWTESGKPMNFQKELYAYQPDPSQVR